MVILITMLLCSHANQQSQRRNCSVTVSIDLEIDLSFALSQRFCQLNTTEAGHKSKTKADQSHVVTI